MRVLLAPSYLVEAGKCDNCEKVIDRKNTDLQYTDYLFRIDVGKKTIALCLKCYRKLSDILVYDFDYSAKGNVFLAEK